MSTTPLLAAAPKTSLAKTLTRRLEVRMVGLAILIAVVLSLLSPFFLTRSNIFNVLDQSVVIGIVSVGMTFVILTGGIDLSVGSVAGLTGIILGLTLEHLPIPAAIAVAVAAGGGIGLVSGLLINIFGLASFVVTLGMMAIGRSLAYILSGQTAISDIPSGLQDIVYTNVLGIPSNILFLILLYVAAWAYLTYTKGGRTIYAVGSNREAARAAGLSTLFYSVLPYVLSGAFAAVAATFSIGQLLSADPPHGQRHGTRRDRRRSDRRREPLRRARLHGRHADGRLHHRDDPQRAQPDGRLALLAGHRHRHHHHRGAPVRTPRLVPGEPVSTRRHSAPSLAVKLFGTEEAVTPPRILRAGPLTAELDAGNLRHIRFGGVEVIRAISFIVRDRNWGTYSPTISDLELREGDGFTVSYRAVADDGAQSFRYLAKIRGNADGRVDFEAEGVAETDFQTNRTGFVVLHPIVGVSGRPVLIEHVDGSIVEGAFPDLIDPVQPMMDIRALTHEPTPGLRVTCRMEGDAYEMEDQRNWADASYKTYVRPLARPWPYVLPAGEHIEQAVRLRVVGPPPPLGDADGSVVLTLGGTQGRAPRLGLGLDPDETGPTRANAAALRALGPDVLVCHYDPRRDHGRETLKALADTAAMIGAEPWLEAVVADVERFVDEVTSLGRDVTAIGSPFPTVLLSPAPDMKGTLPAASGLQRPLPTRCSGSPARLSRRCGSAEACSATSPR